MGLNTISWEVQTGGNSANGGGFLNGGTGTDRSQSTSPFVTFDGVTVLAVTSGTSATITITGYTPVSADVGNVLQISGGTNFTAGFYYVVSISGATWVLDRNCSSGAGAAMTGRMGGCLATIAQCFTPIAANAATDNTIWIKSGTYTSTASINCPNTQYGLRLQGYHTTRGDADGTRPLLTTATNSVDLIGGDNNGANARGISFRNINFSSTASVKASGYFSNANSSGIGAALTFQDCIFDGFTHGIISDTATVYPQSSIILINVEIKNCTTRAITHSMNFFAFGCRIHGNTGDGFRMAGSPYAGAAMAVISDCIIDTNTGHGVYLSASNAYARVVITNTAIHNNTGDGLRIDNANSSPSVNLINVVFTSNGGYGINNVNASSSTAFLLGSYSGRLNCAFYSNTSGATFRMPTDATDITLSVSPWTSSTDYTLNATAGGGAALKALGFPGIIPNGGTGYRDIGPIQSNAGGGGSSGMLFVPNLEGT